MGGRSIDTFHYSSNARRDVKRWSQAKNPSLPPFAFAVLISFCRCFVVAPNSEQKSPITCECKEIALPLNWLNLFTPMIGLTATTSGANTPPSLTFPMDTIFKQLFPDDVFLWRCVAKTLLFLLLILLPSPVTFRRLLNKDEEETEAEHGPQSKKEDIF